MSLFSIVLLTIVCYCQNCLFIIFLELFLHCFIHIYFIFESIKTYVHFQLDFPTEKCFLFLFVYPSDKCLMFEKL